MKFAGKKYVAALMAVSAFFCLTGCAGHVASQSIVTNGLQGSEGASFAAEDIYSLSEADLSVTAEAPTEIIASKDGEVFVIEKAGAYRVTGSYVGQILVRVQDEQVHLILENAQLQSYNGPAIYVESAAKVTLTVPEGTKSSIADSAYYEEYQDQKACVFSEDDLTINGAGELTVYGFGKDAVRSADTLKILDVSLLVQAKDTGLRGNDGVILRDAGVEVQCEDTGIYTKKKERENKGFVCVDGGSLNIIAGRYGVDAAENVYIRESDVDIFGVAGNIVCGGEQCFQEGISK